MGLFKNSDKNGSIRSVEQLPDATGELTVLVVDPSRADEVARTLGKRDPKAQITRVAQEKDTVLLMRRATADTSLAAELGKEFHATLNSVKVPKEKGNHGAWDMNRIRGYLGTGGQIMQQVAGIVEKNPALTRSSGISLTSNLITVAYGTPQRINHKKTEEVRHNVDVLMAKRFHNYEAPKEKIFIDERHKGSLISQANHFVGANNIYISDGMKFASQMSLWKFGNNWVDQTMGVLQASAKVVTFTGADKDPDTPEKDKSWVRRFREHTNPISGALEWSGQFMNAFNAVYLPQIHNVGYDALEADFKAHGIKVVKQHYRHFGEMFSASNWKNFSFKNFRIISPMRAVSVGMFLSGFLAKMFAPFSHKTLDWNEMRLHAEQVLAQVPEAEREQVKTELAGAYMRLAKDKSATFGNIYQALSGEGALFTPKEEKLIAKEEKKAQAAGAAKEKPAAEAIVAKADAARPATSVHTASVLADRMQPNFSRAI